MRRLAITLALVLACSGLAQAADSRPLDVRAVAVYPYAFSWEQPAYRSLLKSSDAVAALAARRKVAVIAPTEFQVSRFDDDNVLAGSDAAKAMAARGLPPRSFVVLRAWAERLGARTVREFTADGVVRSDLSDVTILVAHVQVLDAATGELVVNLSGKLPPDAGGAVPGADPLPDLTALHRRLVASAIEALEPRLGSTSSAGPAEAKPLAAAAFEKYGLAGRASLAEIAARDPIAAAAARQEIARYLAEQQER